MRLACGFFPDSWSNGVAMRLLVLVLAAAVCAQTGEAVASTVENEELDFSFTIPEGFEPNPDPSSNPHTIYSFVSGGPATSQDSILLNILHLRGTMPEGRLTEQSIRSHESFAMFPETTKIDIMGTDWKGFDINVVRMQTPTEKGDLVLFEALVPLTPKAIAIIVGGAPRFEQESRRALDEVLASLEGQSNWSTPLERESSAAPRLLAIASVSALVGLLVLVFRRYRAQRAPSAET